MTIASNKNTPRNTYTATGGQTAFTIGFEFFKVADVKVYRNGSLLTYNASPSSVSQYKITGTASASDDAYEFGSGGTVTLGAGATADDSIVIIRDIVLERTSDFPTTGAFDITSLNTQLDTITSMLSDLKQQSDRSVKLSDTDTVSATITLPAKATRQDKVLSFDSNGNAETTVSSSGLATLGSITSDITAVANIASDVTTVANDATDIGVVAGKATEIGRLGTADAVADMALLGTTDAIADMNTLATSANVTAMGHLGTASNVTAMGLLGTSDVVADMALLGTSDVVADLALLANSDVIADMAMLANSDVISDMNTLAVTDVINDINTLATSDIVSDLNTLATTDIVNDLNTLATTDIVNDLNTLATSDIVSDINTLATSDIVSDLNQLATSDFVSDLNLMATSTNIANLNTVANNITGVNSFAERYRVASSDPSSSLDAGDLAFNTTGNVLKYYDGSAWQGITAGGITDIAQDSTPQLGGNLDLNGNNITGTGGIPSANLTGTIAEARLPASALGAIWESKNSNFTAEARKNYFVDTSSNAVTATLPSSGTAGDEIHFLDVSATFDTNNLTVGRNSHNIQGLAQDMTVDVERAGFTLVYYNATQGWLLKDV